MRLHCAIAKAWPLLLLGWLVSSSPVPAAPAEWRQVESKDFTLLSDADPRDIEQFCLAYAAFREVLTTLFAPDRATLVRPTLVVFRSERALADHVPPSTRRDFKTQVYTTEIDGAPITTLTVAGEWTRALQTAFEAETMWTLRRLGYRLPLWMSQGTGQVLSTVRAQRGVCVFGEDDNRFVTPLRRRGWLEWDRFFDVHTGSPEYAGRDSEGLFHAQAWALMHWLLLKDDQGRERFKDLAERWRTEGSLEAVATVAQRPIDTLTREIGRYINTKAQIRRIPFDSAAIKAAWRIGPADTVRLEVCRAALLESSGRLPAADAALKRAEAVGAGSPLLHEALGRRAQREGRGDEALQFYREAIAAGTVNPAPYLASANARLDLSSVNGADVAGGGARNVAEALLEIRQAIAADPGSAMAYRTLGRALFIAPNLKPDALAELQPGLTLGTESAHVRFYLALLHERLKQMDQHFAELATLATDPETPELLRAQATRRWLTSTLRVAESEAEHAVKIGQFDGARRQLREHITDAEALGVRSDGFKPIGDWIDENEQLARLRALYDNQQWAEFVDRAKVYLVKFPNASNLDRIRSYLEKAEKMLTPAPAP